MGLGGWGGGSPLSLPWFLFQIPDAELNQTGDFFGAFSEQPGKISSPRLPPLSTGPFHAVFRERALCSGGLFLFFIADLYVMYPICRYFIRCPTTQRRKNLNCLFILFFFLAFLTYVWPFCLYSIPLRAPAQLQLHEKSDTTPLLRVCASV